MGRGSGAGGAGSVGELSLEAKLMLSVVRLLDELLLCTRARECAFAPFLSRCIRGRRSLYDDDYQYYYYY